MGGHHRSPARGAPIPTAPRVVVHGVLADRERAGQRSPADGSRQAALRSVSRHGPTPSCGLRCGGLPRVRRLPPGAPSPGWWTGVPRVSRRRSRRCPACPRGQLCSRWWST
ncbi:hypothetical protein QJS66_02240 [Kocuria rhizophila]|nr:hypothetical protein QJS66_02240 [Kocuria rhizophila]